MEKDQLSMALSMNVPPKNKSKPHDVLHSGSSSNNSGGKILRLKRRPYPLTNYFDDENDEDAGMAVAEVSVPAPPVCVEAHAKTGTVVCGLVCDVIVCLG
eukprot:GEZU01033002.1.p1 GENE.GEZU01033002.1~~GEZU01033002.1.p1  ORF type:complete len:100 (-),score=17.81 GEZU01033002.1:166-465(-)